MWKVKILTLAPEIYPGPLGSSISGKALNSGLWSIETKNIRDFTSDKNSRVDDTPFGGGCGMILRADILGKAIESFFLNNSFPILYLTPRGNLFNKNMAKSFVELKKGINILCGRFEGVDERVIKEYKILEVSVGDYILSSGDIALFVIIDCCLRYLDGYLGNRKSLEEESFGEGKYENLLEYPQFTKPRVWNLQSTPSVLLSGHHKKIAEWRLNQSKSVTMNKRPDLWNKYFKGAKK